MWKNEPLYFYNNLVYLTNFPLTFRSVMFWTNDKHSAGLSFRLLLYLGSMGTWCAEFHVRSWYPGKCGIWFITVLSPLLDFANVHNPLCYFVLRELFFFLLPLYLQCFYWLLCVSVSMFIQYSLHHSLSKHDASPD